MRKSLLFMLLFLGSLTCFAQTYHEDDKEGLRNFLRQPSAVEGLTHLDLLNSGRPTTSLIDSSAWYEDEEWVTKVNPNWNDEVQFRAEWSTETDNRKRLINLTIEIYWKGGRYPVYFAENIDLSNFTELTYLKIRASAIKTIDLSKNTKLSEVIIAENLDFESIDLSKNKELTSFICYYNPKLKKLDFSENKKLQEINCNTNAIESLKLPISENLTSVICYTNQLAKLDISQNPNISNLDCKYNKMKLSTLPIPNESYTKWDVSPQGNVDESNIAPNTEINLSSEAIINGKNSTFRWVDANDKDITAKITNKGNGIFVIGSEFLDQILTCKIKNETFPQLEMSHIFKVEEVFQIYGERDKEGLRKLLRQPAYKEGRFNFEYFGLTAVDTLQWHRSEKWVETINSYISGQEPFYWEKGEDGYMHLVDIDFSGPPRNSLELGVLSGELDFSYFSELAYINCNLQRFTSVDLSQNPKLITLDLSINRLQEIDLSNNTKLEVIILNNNKIENINLSNNPLIDWLDVSNNQISSLNLQKNKDLIRLFATSNQLTEVNISESTKLSKLDISKNKLTAVDLSKNTELTFVNISFNKLTAVDISANTELTEADVSFNKLTQLDISKNLQLTRIDATSNFIKEFDLSKNANLLNVNIGANFLTNLDISKNLKLSKLVFFNNCMKLSTLPIPNSSNLKTIGYTPQQPVDEGEVKRGAEVDLSSESVIAGINSVYTWESEMGEDITSQMVDKGNGKFVIETDPKFINQFIICSITNSKFPSISMSHVFRVLDTTTGIDSEKTGKTEIKIYPNPVTDVLYLESDEEVKTATLFDISGRILKAEYGNIEQINVTDLPKGFYILKTTTQSGKQSTHKIKKQ